MRTVIRARLSKTLFAVIFLVRLDHLALAGLLVCSSCGSAEVTLTLLTNAHLLSPRQRMGSSGTPAANGYFNQGHMAAGYEEQGEFEKLMQALLDKARCVSAQTLTIPTHACMTVLSHRMCLSCS